MKAPNQKIKISGRVIKGDGYGKKIGFPTINIDRREFSKLKNKPILGIYRGEVILGKKIYIWKKAEVKNGHKITVVKEAKTIVPKLSQKKLKDLSWSLDVKEKIK